LKALNETMNSVLESNKISKINFEKEFKIADFKTEDKGLKKLSEKVKKQVCALYWMLNKYLFKALPYCSSFQKGISGSGYEMLSKTKTCLLSSVK
jgi:hypothetical protein